MANEYEIVSTGFISLDSCATIEFKDRIRYFIQLPFKLTAYSVGIILTIYKDKPLEFDICNFTVNLQNLSYVKYEDIDIRKIDKLQITHVRTGTNNACNIKFLSDKTEASILLDKVTNATKTSSTGYTYYDTSRGSYCYVLVKDKYVDYIEGGDWIKPDIKLPYGSYYKVRTSKITNNIVVDIEDNVRLAKKYVEYEAEKITELYDAEIVTMNEVNSLQSNIEKVFASCEYLRTSSQYDEKFLQIYTIKFENNKWFTLIQNGILDTYINSSHDKIHNQVFNLHSYIRTKDYLIVYLVAEEFNKDIDSYTYYIQLIFYADRIEVFEYDVKLWKADKFALPCTRRTVNYLTDIDIRNLKANIAVANLTKAGLRF